MSANMWEMNAGKKINVEELFAKIITASPQIEGITVSGGEPSLQAAAVGELFQYGRQHNLNTFLYSGYTFEELQSFNNEDINKLLALTDILVDGRFDDSAMGEFLWRGSSNQRIINLSNKISLHKYKNLRSNIQFRLNFYGEITIIGVPPKGFIKEFQKKMQRKGLQMNIDYMTED